MLCKYNLIWLHRKYAYHQNSDNCANCLILFQKSEEFCNKFRVVVWDLFAGKFWNFKIQYNPLSNLTELNSTEPTNKRLLIFSPRNVDIIINMLWECASLLVILDPACWQYCQSCLLHKGGQWVCSALLGNHWCRKPLGFSNTYNLKKDIPICSLTLLILCLNSKMCQCSNAMWYNNNDFMICQNEKSNLYHALQQVVALKNIFLSFWF